MPRARSQRDLATIAVERLESALYKIQTGGDPTGDALVSIAATMLRTLGPAK